jgi:CubicO group peptidase (beta-lactamase class C family)
MDTLLRTAITLALLTTVVGGCYNNEQLMAKVRTEAEQLEETRLREFQYCEVVPKQSISDRHTGDYCFMHDWGEAPDIGWKKPYFVEQVMGKIPLSVRWFDSELNEVATGGDKPGRYGIVVEGTTGDGIHIRRGLTIYCSKEFFPFISGYGHRNIYVEYLPQSGIDRGIWEQQKDAIASWAGDEFLSSIYNRPAGALLMSYLAEAKPHAPKPAKTDTPRIRNHEYHLALKRKLMDVEDKYPPLKMPRKIKGKPAPVLHAGSPSEAGVKPDAAGKIRDLCNKWYAGTDEPFVVLVARRGVIIIHEAFGQANQRSPVNLDTPMLMASVTKTLTGLMFAQFLEQELISLDDPVGKYLPDFPVEGDQAITLRHCFTHTAGFDGHFKWGTMDNPYFENVAANGLTYYPKPGTRFEYDDIGYNLVGKVMEVVSGKSALRLMQENFFAPMDMLNTTMDDMGAHTMSTAEDMAKVAQLMLNKGSYGDFKFFSPETFEQLLPLSLRELYGIDTDEHRGIGLEWWLQQLHPDAGKGDVPADKTILSRHVAGHGAGSGAVFGVDLENELVIVQTREKGWKDYEKYLSQFLMAIAEGLEN